METIGRLAGIVAIATLLFLGAAGFSGHLDVEDLCDSGASSVEGSFARSDTRWAPPGIQCSFQVPSGIDAKGHFVYAGGMQQGERTGSWAAFLGALLLGFSIVGAALRRRPDVPAWLRLTASTALAFAASGAAAILGGWEYAVAATIYVGIPVAFAVDRWLLRPKAEEYHSRSAGFAGVVVALAAFAIASAGFLYGLGAAAYGLTILLVGAVAAVPWARLRPRLPATG